MKYVKYGTGLDSGWKVFSGEPGAFLGWAYQQGRFGVRDWRAQYPGGQVAEQRFHTRRGAAEHLLDHYAEVRR